VLNKQRTHNIAEYVVQFAKVNKLPFSDDNLQGVPYNTITQHIFPLNRIYFYVQLNIVWYNRRSHVLHNACSGYAYEYIRNDYGER